MEDAITGLKAQKTCSEMRGDVQTTFTRLFEEHHDEQLKFDADEKKRIRKLLTRNKNS